MLTNRSLKSEIKSILTSQKNIVKIKKGGVSNFSIEIETQNPESHCSYVYYDKELVRDLDFNELEVLILEYNKTK
jgi:hypothetical protein|tara:strand:- start:7687 stop:7911 length:225 start_codon:yes stop_codon:yes gene_type:complete